MGFKSFHSCNFPKYAEGMNNTTIWECNECEKKYIAEVDTHWSHVDWMEILDGDNISVDNLNSDLNKFIELYDSFGVNNLYINKTDGRNFCKSNCWSSQR